MTEFERRLKQAEENEKARQSTGKGTTSTQTRQSAASSSSGRSDTERRLRIAEEQDRQAAKSSTWWEDYKKTQRFKIANRQLEKNRSRDAAEDEIRELFRNPFSSDAEWQAGVLQRNADRYKRDLTLYQEAMKNASTSGEYFSAHRQAVEAQSAVKHQFERYQQAAQKAEQDRDESNLVNRPALYASEHMTPEQISAELDRLRSGAATPTVTDKDRNDPVYAYMYPDAVLRKDPHGARFDERLVEDAGQDAIDALYRPILTEQEKAAVEEADRKIIEDKANRNYERVQILKAAQSMQTERTSRETGNRLMEEIATGGEAAKQVETGRAAFEAKQHQIASETSFEIGDDLDSNRGAYNKMQKERRERGYILGYDWDNVPEDRKQAVYALYAQDPEKAMELAKYYIADARLAEDEDRQAWYAQSGWTAALGLVSSAAAHLGAAVDPFGDVGQELTRRGDNALAGGSQWADAATDYKKIPEWVPIVGGKGAGDFYQTVGSVVQSAAVAAPAILVGRYDQAAAEVVSKLGLVLMGSSAAASDYRESVAAGMDEDRAKLHALAAGVEEALFEEVSLDKLIKMDTSGGLKSAIKNWLVQSGIEGSEELATSIANRITDEMISGAGQSKVERRASELIANGMNSTQAHTQAENEWMTDTLYEGFSGFLSGGMMTGGNYALKGLANLKGRAVNAAVNREAQKQAGAAVSRSEGSVEALQAYAKDNGIEIKAVETAEQNAGESAEQGKQGGNQNSYSSRDYRSISDTNSKVVQSIRSEVRGKTAQEQQAVRDSLVEKYGDGIAPAVYNAISIETASRVRQEYGDVDSIQAARNQAVSEIKDESLRRAVSDGYDSAAYSLAASQGGESGMNAMSRYIQQRRNTGSGSEMSMNATVTAQDGSTKAIAITGMSEDGKRVSLADGSEVAVKDLQADADTTSAIQQIADLDLGDDATKVLQAYQQSGISGTEGYRWLMDYATAYNQGRTRQISLEQAAQRSSLDERTVMDAYTLGQQAANRETMAGLEKLKNLPKRKGASGRTANIDTTEIKGKTMSKSELEQFELANQYAQALGVDMKWFSSKEQDGKFIGKNGAYENGKIYMDIHAGRNFATDLTSGILSTMGHELTHFQQQYAPEEYQAIKEFLFEQIVKSSPNGEARLERLIWEKQRRSGYTLSRKAAEDEVVADACQKMLRDSKTVHDFASQQPQAANGVVRWLDKWFKRVRSIFGRGGNYSEEAQLMDSLEQDVKAAFGELWDKALKQAVQVHDEVGNIEKPATEGESKEEIKAQNSERDEEYLELAKDPEKNADRLQEMVDEAAKRAGYTIKAYHGTTENFTQFSQEKQGQNHKGYLEFGAGFYFTPSEKEARNWAERGKNGPARAKDSKVMAVYLNPGRIIEADNTIPGGKKYLEGIGLTEEDASFVANRAYRFINYLLEDKGYSNVEVQDRLKAMGFDAVEDTYRNRTEGQYVVFAPEQVKSADPVTYDDDGNVIPLSERFNTENQDIRYSQREQYEEAVEASDVLTKYSLREAPAPQKTIKAYKAFYVKDGKLYPPMVSNNTNEEDKQTVKKASSGTMKGLETPVGVWLDADVGGIAVDENGVPLRTKTTGRLQVQNDKGGGTLAFRPGWHLGEWPDASQFNVKDPVTGALKSVMPDNLVFAECEIAADVDYQLEAYEYGISDKGGFSRTQAGLPRVPTNGYYKYRTNVDPTTAPWYITGAMKVTRILSDEERRQICNQFGVTPQKRASHKDIDLEAYGLKAGPVKQTENLERFRKNKASYDNDALLKAALEDENYSNAYVRRTLDFDNETLVKEFELDRILPDQVKKYRESYQSPEVMRSERESAAKTNVSLDSQSESAAPMDGLLYSERDNAKPRSAQAQRDAGYKLSESKFYSLYSAHKLNMIGKGNVQEQIFSIMADGFKGDGGFGNNVMPTNISYDVDENGKRIPRGLSAQKYAPKKGEYILLVPKEGVEVKGGRYNFTERVKPGYKPAFDYEIVQADYDGQPYYEMYERAYDKSQAGKADVTLDGAQFSMREPVEQTDRLIALHNLSAEKLSKALALGGFPMPSIAVTKTSIPHTNFGPITLVMDKSTIDPMQDRRNTVYSADAWTPTFPSVEYEVNEKVESRLRRKYYDLEKKFGRDAADPLYPWGNYAEDELNRRGGPEEVIDRYHDDTDMMKLFLLDSGLSVPENVKEVQVKRMDDETIEFYDLFVNEMGKDAFEELKPREGETIPETRKRWWADHGEKFESVYRKYMKDLNFSDEEISNVLENETISSQTRKALQMRNYIRTGPETRNETVNVTATNAAIRAAVDAEQYDAWLHGLFDGLVKSRGIYNGKDRFTPSGNSRSFASTHYSVTLENIAKAMAAQNDGNSRNVSGFYGVKSLRAGLAKRFSSIAEMHKYEGRLQHLTEEQAEKINDALADRLSDVTARIYNSVPHSDYDSYFIAIDSIGNDLMEITEQKNITKESIQRVLSKYGYKISDTLAEDIRTLLFDVSQMPVNIYEAKPERAVRFDEVLAAIVPTGTDKSLLEKLRDAGVQNLIEYAAGDDTDRLAKVNSVEGAQFSERDYSVPSDEELLMNAKVEDADNADQGRLLKDYQALGERIATLEKQLAEAKRQTQLTNRALNTRGIGNVVKTVMKDYDITDARHNGTAKNATLALTEGYQKALDILDKGASPAEVNDAVYNGAVKAAEIILEQGTYSQNLGGKWQVYSASRYLGENSQELIDSFVSEAYADFVSNRYREARPETAADRLVARTKKEAQERVDKYKGRSDALAEANRRLEEKKTQAETEAKEARKAAGELFLEIKDLRQELMDNKTMSEQERKAASKKLKSLNKSLEAKREEAASWQKRAKRNASLLKSALESKSRDISALNNRLSKEQAAALEKQKNLEAKLEKQIQRERDILAGKLRSPELVKLLKAEREKAEARVKKQKEQVFQNYKERKKAGELRGRIKNLSDEMKRRMTNPTDRAYVPASLYQSMTKLADVLDNVLSPNPGTKAEARYRAMMDAIRGMAREYEDVKNLDPVFASEYDQEVIDAIGEIERILERKNASWIDGLAGDTQKSFAELNSDELQQLYDLMQQINYTIANATKVFGNLRYESIREAIASGLEQQSKITPINDVSKKERNKRLGVMSKRSPMRAVEYMSNMDRGAALYEAFQQVEAGDEQRLAWSLAYQNDFRELKSGKNEKTYWQSLTKQIDYGATDKKTGKPVTMTKMQAIQIFMTAQREAANKNLEHFFKGGATIRNAKDIMEGKGNIRSNEVFVTPELLKNIENSFTEWDRQYMSRMRDYLKREGKAVNKVFYKLKHRVLPLEENYVPTIVDQKYLDAKLETTDFSGLFVKSPRSTKPITEGAPQPLIIDGMETMMNKHVQEQAQYIGMATAIRDFAKIFNGKVGTNENGVGYTSLKAEIERNFGEKGVHLIKQALIDIQGGSTQSGWKSGLEDFLKKLQTSFVRHALLFNLSVTIKQAASYVAAGSIISREALLKGNRSILNKNEASHSASLITQIFLNPNGKTAQKIFARADKYTALHADRRNGMNFAEIELGQKNYGKLRQKAAEIGANLEQRKGGHKIREIGAALNPASWIQRMDVATTAALFVACEYQARMDGLEGEAYHAKVKELYERVLRETQPMYDSLHRTAQQKSGGSLAQYLFPFRTVPIQNHGQMASAYDRLLAAKTKSDTEKAEAAKFFRKTLISQIESAVVFSAMTFAAALTKRKTKKYRDEDGELTLESVARGFGLDVASTLVSVASPMWGSELWSLSDRFINKFTGKGGYTYDSFSVGALDMINDTAAAIDKIAADVGKAMRREDVSPKEFGTHMFSLLTKLGNLSGIPADTIKTYTEGFIGNIQDAIDGRIPALNDESWERDAATNARRYLKAYLDNDTQKASAVLAELRSNLSKSGKGEEKINEAIRKYVSAQAIEKVADGTWTEKEAEAYLLSTGAYDDRENPQKDAWNAIRKGVAKSTSTDEEFNWKQYDDLAEAVANGEDVTGLLTEYRNHGYSDDQINSAIKSGIQEALTAGDLDEDEAADALIRYGVTYSKDGKDVVYDEQTAWKKVQEWADKAEHTDEEGELEDGYKYSAYTDLFDAVDANQNADGIIQTMVQNGGYDTDGLRSQIKDHLLERFIDGQITETALKNQLSRYCKIPKAEDANEIVKNAKCKRDFGVFPDGLKEAFKDGDLSQNQAEKALQQYKGLSKTDAQNRVQYWGYDGDLSENAWTKWAHELKSTGLSVDNWEKVYKVKSSAKGTDANGDGRADSGTVKAEVVAYIDSMNIPKSQKKAIYLAFGWAASTMPSWR